MIDPTLAWLTALALALALAALFWPARGAVWRTLRAFRAGERVLIEDALKHLYDCEYHGYTCTLQSLAGALGLGGGRAAELLARLQQRELAAPVEAGHGLTSEGRRYALRVIRIHRLWEKYFSDETGVPPREWHSLAEIEEHRTSPNEADRLAARMGHPRFDPHGDPIPTADGEIAPRRGRPLTELAAGKPARIVHVEDEPEAVYEQLLAAGLHPGMWIRILESSTRLIRLEADADEHVLAPAMAANVWVEPVPDAPWIGEQFVRLSTLEVGGRARVAGISARCRGAERRRMLDLGLVPGTVVKAEMTSPGGDPTAYRIRGAMIALRREQADQIHVERDPGEGAS
jgi:DtxR family Mn-dependent transcriptional regulator